MDESDQSCPRCKTTKYRNPSLKLMVNVCGHALCENCVNLLFVKGSGNCPSCATVLRRTNFRVQIFDDPLIEKELMIRRKILRDFNKKEGDFDSLREYNDYLEMIETIIFNLSNNIDVEATKRTIENYKRENKDFKSKCKGSADEELIERLIECEQQTRQLHIEQMRKEQIDSKKFALNKKEELIDDLMFSDLPASQILASHDKQKQQQELEMMQSQVAARKAVPTEFSTGIKVGGSSESMFLPVPQLAPAKLYQYVPLTREYLGPEPPDEIQVVSEGYTKHVRPAADSETAGGYVNTLACLRALQDAMCGLYFEHT